MKLKKNLYAARKLRAARALLAKPMGWIKGGSKQEGRGRGQTAVGYCLTGAIDEVGDGVAIKYLDEALPTLKMLRKMSGSLYSPRSRIQAFNDRDATRKADVLALIDKAIAMADPQTP